MAIHFIDRAEEDTAFYKAIDESYLTKDPEKFLLSMNGAVIRVKDVIQAQLQYIHRS